MDHRTKRLRSRSPATTLRTVLLGVLGVLLAACAAPAVPAPDAASSSPGCRSTPLPGASSCAGAPWAALSRDVDPVLRRLAEPIEACIRRSDTSHPAFHGCIDWHSAVHATYALLVISRVTGDPQYTATALQATGGPEAVAREVADLTDGLLVEEEPYGPAWALVLAAEARTDGVNRFEPLGRAAADTLGRYLTSLDPARLTSDAVAPEYGNALWAVAALARWGRVAHDARATAAAQQVGGAALRQVDVQTQCVAELHGSASGFLSPCALVYVAADELGQTGDGLSAALPVLRQVEPLQRAGMVSAHNAGLNFSRAWGSFAAAHRLAAFDLCDVGATLVNAHLALEDRWRSGYDRYAHWVAQFGVFAVDEALRGCPPGTTG